MSRRRRRLPIHVTLVLPTEPPTRQEIDTILLAADAIVGQAGRSGLTLILNGSRSQKALRWKWHELPDHGALQHLTADPIARKVDWCIHHRWLNLDYDRDGVPLLSYTERGWERAKRAWVERTLGRFEEWLEAGRPGRVSQQMGAVHREIQFALLEAIGERGRRDPAAVLRAWYPNAVRAVRKAINRTLDGLGLPMMPEAGRASGRGKGERSGKEVGCE